MEQRATKTLIVVLEDAKEETRVDDVIRAEEEGQTLIAYDEHEQVKGRFRLRDIRSWHLADF